MFFISVAKQEFFVRETISKAARRNNTKTFRKNSQMSLFIISTLDYEKITNYSIAISSWPIDNRR